MQQLGLVSEDEYLDRLRGAVPGIVETELRNLLNLVTVTETCFFRDASQFRLLRDHIVPALDVGAFGAADDRSKRIRIWSAGCSSGEEAYSIAITLDEMGVLQAVSRLDRRDHRHRSQHGGAREGAPRCVHGARRAQRRRPAARSSISWRDGKTFALSDAIKKRVSFEFGNLTQTPMPSTGPQDVVFCKNVAIYFSGDVTRKLIDGIRDTLAPGGYLLLGHAESLWQMSEDFTLVEHERAFCYQKSRPVRRLRSRASAPVAPNRAARRRQRRGRLKPDTTAPSGRYRRSVRLLPRCLSRGRLGRGRVGAHRARRVHVRRSCPALLLLGGLYAHRGRFDEAMEQGGGGAQGERSRTARAPAARHDRGAAPAA